MIQIGVGSPSRALVPILVNPVLPRSARPPRFGNVAPPEMSSAAPRATYRTPSVAMNGGTRNRATSRPLSAPAAMPPRSAMTTTSHALK